jgi:hypothetical protein
MSDKLSDKLTNQISLRKENKHELQTNQQLNQQLNPTNINPIPQHQKTERTPQMPKATSKMTHLPKQTQNNIIHKHP